MALKLGKLDKGTETKKSGTNYPRFNSDPVIKKIVTEFLEVKAKYEALEGSMKVLKSQLNETAVEPFFKFNEGKAEPVNGIVFDGENEGENVLVSFIRKYGSADSETLVETLGKAGKQIAREYFYEKLAIKIDGDKIPAEKQQQVIDKIVAVFTEFDCIEAVDARVVMTPNENFHASRHTVLSVEQNQALHGVLPCQTQVKKYSK